MKSYSFAEKNMRRMRMEVFNDLVKSFSIFFLIIIFVII